MSERLIRAGLFPVLTCRNRRGVTKIESKLANFTGSFRTAVLDFSDPGSMDGFMEQLDGTPEFLVDMVQGNLEKLMAGASDREIFDYFKENVAFRAAMLKRVSRAMLKNRKGRLIFISSTAAILPNPGQGFYAAAKLASEALYRNLGLELGGRGITSVSLRPGYIDAGRGKKWLEAEPDVMRKLTPLQRAISAEEVAETVLFLLSDGAAGMNAVEITLDGGMTAGKPPL